MVPDPSLLALVLDDPLAPVVLSWWKARRPGRGLVAVGATPPSARSRLSRDAMAEICRVSRQSPYMIEATIERCEIAGLFESEDGGISTLADKWLSTHVAQQLGARQGAQRDQQRDPKTTTPVPRKRDRGSVAVALAVALVVSMSLALQARVMAVRLDSPASVVGVEQHPAVRPR